MIREATKHRKDPPALYGHNAGIGLKTRGIWREVIDLLARLDGIDFRQTAPLRPGTAFLRPYGAEWLASEETLSGGIPGINPTMIVRAGALARRASAAAALPAAGLVPAEGAEAPASAGAWRMDL